MTAYPEELDEAVALLCQARDENKARDEKTANLEDAHPVRKEIREERLEIIGGFLAVAAIKAGVPLSARLGSGLDDPETKKVPRP